MSIVRPRLVLLISLMAGWLAVRSIFAGRETDAYLEPAPPVLALTSTNQGLQLRWPLFPATQRYQLWSAPEAGAPFGLAWTNLPDLVPPLTIPATESNALYFLEAETLDTNALLAVTVLQRLAYGPTPDELNRVRTIGADAYVAEQLAPETLVEDLPHRRRTTNEGWQYVSATGIASATRFYVYLNKAGEAYIDDLELVAGTVPGVGPNLLRNGDFEAPLSDADWTLAINHAGSERTTDLSHTGAACLHLRATEGGGSRFSVISQDLLPEPTLGKAYTLSYWWLASTNDYAPLTVRFAGSGLATSPGSLQDKLDSGGASLSDLRSWHLLNAISSRRQLLEVLLQFLDNHFVTEVSKTAQFLNFSYPQDGQDAAATELEFKELNRWRQALLNPSCTFYDLLRVSAESPAMIIYLDTAKSEATRGSIANENYARELLELFTFGVDNGYEQRDIEEMARVWTGWTVRFVRPEDEGNPFAPTSDRVRPGGSATSLPGIVTNFLGTWSYAYREEAHGSDPKYLFYQYDANGERLGPKTYPARFGPAYAGQPYGLAIPALTGTNGMSEGYAVLQHLADQPFTQEFVSVKLCRLFVHDDFQHGTYDYTAPDLSPEATLVKECMEAWQNGQPRGQIRQVLATIFRSPLFRRHGASLQKVKTPLEFAASSIRSLMALRTDGSGTFTATADPLALQVFLRRGGEMNLFDRENPDGYPESGSALINSGTISERLRFIQAFLMPLSYGAKTTDAGTCAVDVVALVQQSLPAESQRDAAAVADLFLALLYPAEGRANLAGYRDLAIRFLETSDSGQASSPLAQLSLAGTPSPYEIRLRAMVSMLMTLPRIHEQ